MADVVDEERLSRREKFSLIILCLCNIFNYMDRFGVAGILIQIQAHFKIGDDLGGLLQSALIISYLLSAPVFGYLSDRYSRCLLLMLCTGMWSTMVLFASFSVDYWQFLICRTMMGVFQSGFTTIAPTVIGDIVIKDARSKMFSLFNVAIPLGSGMGYIVSSAMAHAFNGWQWGLRFTPIFNFTLTVLLYFAKYPDRGEKEAKAAGRQLRVETTSYKEDLKYLFHNPTFMLLTLGLTAVTFVTGALAWWAPKCLYYGFRLIPGRKEDIHFANVMFIFGAITVAAGIIGAGSGTVISLLLRPLYLWADPVICGVGFLFALPLLSGAMITAPYTEVYTYSLIFFGQWTMNLNWPIVPDIILYVVIPTRRGSAVALQILIQHALGDLWSPYIVGALSESFRTRDFTGFHDIVHPNNSIAEEEDDAVFHRLQISLLCITVVHLMGVFFFFLSAFFVERGRKEAEELTTI